MSASALCCTRATTGSDQSAQLDGVWELFAALYPRGSAISFALPAPDVRPTAALPCRCAASSFYRIVAPAPAVFIDVSAFGNLRGALNNFIEQVESWGMRLRAVISNLPPRVVHGARCLGHFVSRVLIDGSCWYVNDTRVAPCESLLSLDSDAWQPSPRFPEGVPPPWSYAALCFAPDERVDFSEIRAAFGQPPDPPPLPPEPQPDQRRRRPPSMFSGCLSLAERARLSNLPFHSHGPPCPDSSSQAADPAPCLIILDD